MNHKLRKFVDDADFFMSSPLRMRIHSLLFASQMCIMELKSCLISFVIVVKAAIALIGYFFKKKK